MSETRRGRGRAAATLALIEKMVEIAEEIQPCNVRAIAYPLFVKYKLIPSMELKHTRRVSELSVIAREEGSLPWEWIVDPTREEEGVPTWANPAAYSRFVLRGYRLDKWYHQPVHFSVWSEKATVAGTIRPILEKYEVPFQVLHGWSGATPVWDAAQANIGRHQKTRILYIGDHDPSGMYMSEVDLVKRLARYSSLDPSEKDIDIETARQFLQSIDLTIRRVALTEADTIALGPATRFPASTKSKDSRYAWFVRNHGRWCWELDALSPNVLRRRLEEAILAELDMEAWERYARVERAQVEAMTATCEAWGSISVPDQE
jgi:hypothetical protein